MHYRYSVSAFDNSIRHSGNGMAAPRDANSEHTDFL